MTTTTTTTVKDCNLEGEGRVTDCTLEGTGVITVPPPCVRPTGLRTFTLMTGYNIVTPPSTVVSTGSQTDACNAITYVTSTPNFTYTSIGGQATSLTVSQTVYANNGTTDCSVVPDGWYFTDESANTTTDVYQIVSGVIINIVQCFAPSTTTTTTTAIPCISYTAIKSTVGVVTVNYTDCTGAPATASVGLVGGGPSSVTFCGRCCPSTPPEVTLTNNGIC
jgi:hypothetical protein